MTTILLVEDTLDLAAMIQRELEANDYTVHHAADGQAALEWYASHTPDLVILDWMLPRLNGLDVLRRIRKDSPVPILMLTARSEEADRVIGLEVGADDYLTKPFSLRELVARVHALLRRIENVQAILTADRQSVAAEIACGPLHLDSASYQAAIHGVALDLTRTEFDLLCLLARNPGRVFNRTYLLETVWGADYVSGDRSVDNAVLRLRKKLGDFGESIETVWGIGYRLKR